MINQDIDPSRACDLCRERRVKCDKRKPSCARCEKVGKPCPGYAKKRKFVDQGAVLRKRFATSSTTDNATEKPTSQDLQSSFANGHQQEHQPSRQSQLGIQPSSQHFIDKSLIRDEGWKKVLPRYVLDRIIPSADGPYALPPGEAIPISANIFGEPPVNAGRDSPLADCDQDVSYDPELFNLDPELYYSIAGNSCGFNADHTTVIDGANPGEDSVTVDDFHDSLTSHNHLETFGAQSQLQISQLISDQRDHDIAYLTRHFCEHIGPWMDLFDAECHFAQLVPLRALRDVLLKNAMAAVAAKHLGCTEGEKPFATAQSQPPSAMEIIGDEVDWFYKAANYYDKAIAYSRVYLQALSGGLSSPPSPDLSASLDDADSDDLLLAVSIFSLYEYLDNADRGWMQHLTGLRTILSVLSPPIVHSSDQKAIALGRQASFWNFVRADYQSSYINKSTPLLDTTDLAIWTGAGLQISADGSLYTKPKTLAQDRGGQSGKNELVAHTLLWILLRIMTCLFSEGSDGSKMIMWKECSDMLDSWQAARPQSFQPCARVRHPFVSTRNISELFFSIPLCAATTQLYHFARVLLLMHRPTAIDFEGPELLSHVYNIIGIALGRPCAAVRVEMLLPLFVAGSCLEADEERRLVIELLQAIQKDTGCKAGSKVKALAKLWGWTSEQIAGI